MPPVYPTSSSSSPPNCLIRKSSGGVQAALENPVRGVRGIGPKRKQGMFASDNKSTHDLESFTASWALHRNRQRPRTVRPTLQQFRTLGADRQVLHEWMVLLKLEVRHVNNQYRKLTEEARVLGPPSEAMASRLRGCASRIYLLIDEISAYRRCCRQWKQAVFGMLKTSREHRKWELAHTSF